MLNSTTGTTANSYRYTAREYDSETGLYYYRARYYDSAVGRFISEDPLGFGAGDNFYDYVGNEPTGWVDPSGLSGSKPGGPYHPPTGIKTKCRITDTCQQLRGKLWVLSRMITSHTGWDRVVGKPDGGNRHTPEIDDLWIQWAYCQNLYASKGCTECQKSREASQEERERLKQTAKASAVVVGVAVGVAIAPEITIPIVIREAPHVIEAIVH